jgi:HK97 family phage prohead protease
MATKNRNNLPFEYKSLPMSFKGVDIKTGFVKGYLGAFGNIDHCRDKLMKGSAAKSIAERGPLGSKQIKYLKQHDRDFPLGSFNVLKEDSFGIYYEANILEEIEYAKDTLLLIDAGVYNEHSIGYSVIKSTFIQNPDDDRDWHFELNEIKLYEGSVVLWGMNENTPFVKSGDNAGQITILNEQLSRILKGLRIPGLTDEAYIELEKQHAQIILKYTEIDSLIKAKPETAITTSNENKPDDEAQRLKEAHDKDVQQKSNEFSKTLKQIFNV